MLKAEYIEALASNLGQLRPEDAARAADYCREMIDDRMEEGMGEEQAVAALEPPGEMARRILLEQPLNVLVKARMKKHRRLTALEIILISVGLPLWLPLLAAGFAVALCVYVVLWTMTAVLFAVTTAFAVSALACLLASALLPGYGIASRLLAAGAGLLAAGMGILLFFAGLYAAKGMARLSAAIVRGLKGLFIRKEEA